jgi:hypothetical protein
LIAGVGADGGYSTAATLADFDLSLYLNRRSGRRLIARSDSPGDNVESLTLAGLTPGDYQLVLTSDVRSYYGIAWYGETAPGATPTAAAVAPEAGFAALSTTDGGFMSAAPEPGGWLMFSAASTLLLGRRRCRRQRSR